ncbi:MAG: ATP-binding protein [Desulfuromonadales bacterium]|nr:ATP-binding protein [Desulfuromonadales bacterium]
MWYRMRKAFCLVGLFLCLVLQVTDCAAEMLKVGIRADRRPLEFATSQGGAAGVLVDLWTYWGEQNGVDVSFVVNGDEEIGQLLQSGQIDIIANARPGGELVYSAPYFTYDYFLFSEKNRYLESPQSLLIKVGLLAVDEPFLDEALLNFSRIQSYQNYQELLEDMHVGVIDFMLSNDLNLNFSVISDIELFRLNYPKHPFYNYPVRAAALGAKLALIETFDKGMRQIPPQELTAIKSRWIQSTVGYRLPWSLIGFAMIVFIASSLMLVAWIMKLKLEQQVAEQTLVLEAQKQALEQDIERRKLLEQELKQAKLLAVAATDAKSNFLANMTHELRTPLIGVLGMNELLMTTSLSERQKALTITVQRSGEVLLSLVSDILDFSKIESEKLTLETVPADLSHIVEETVLLLAGMAAEKNVALVCQVAPDACWEVSADPLRLRQVLLNLISNAVKFTEQGEIVVRLAMTSRDDHAGFFTIEVEDTGIGMNTEDHNRIFAPFVQIDSAATRTFGGTGLGLAIVRQLVDLMGGSLTLESRVGEGSLFRVQLALPLLARLEPQFAEKFHGCRVLVQGSNRRALAALEEKLTFLHAHVVAVETAGDAWLQLINGQLQGAPFALAMISPTAKVADEGLLYDKISHEQRLAGLQMIILCSSMSMLKERRLPELPLLEEPVTWSHLITALGNAFQENRRPLEKQLEPLSVSSQERVAQGASDTPCGRILVVDDYAVTRELIRNFLEPCGLVIDEASSGLEALGMLANERYGLVLMDCNMPGMGGMEAAHLLRQQGCLVPIVAMTAHVDSRIHEECLTAGMDGCLLKPFRRNNLEAIVNKWLNAEARKSSAQG